MHIITVSSPDAQKNLHRGYSRLNRAQQYVADLAEHFKNHQHQVEPINGGFRILSPSGEVAGQIQASWL